MSKSDMSFLDVSKNEACVLDVSKKDLSVCSFFEQIHKLRGDYMIYQNS